MNTEFRTPVAPLTRKGLISHATPLLLLGSCFASNIGARLQRDMFDVTVNPFGTLYNPASIAAACGRIAAGTHFTEDDIVEGNGCLHSWHCHSSLSAKTHDRGEYLSTLNRLVDRMQADMCNVGVAILTFGTRHVYRLNSNGMVVANCHKFPAAEFDELDMDVEQCTGCIEKAIAALRSINPDMRIVLTVSPVRYVGEGLHNSALSKSTLLIACDSVCTRYEGVIYFPSYEIMMDDLRDYRFYASDMKHPSDVAVDYIYSIFSESFFDSHTVEISDRCRRLSARLAHRSLSGQPDERFEKQTCEIAERLIAEHPELTDVVNKILPR